MRSFLRHTTILLLLVFAYTSAAHGQDNSRWDASFGAAGVSSSPAGNHYYRMSYVYDMESVGNDLYVAGAFTSAGGVPATALARWDGERWFALPGITYGTISTMAAGPNGDLYVGGYFTIVQGTDTMRTIARWDGSRWHRMGGELLYYGSINVGIGSMAVDGNNVYVSGAFTTAGTTDVTGLARWDGSRWHAVGNTSTAGYIATLAARDGKLYAGGYNQQIGAEGVFNLSMWDGSKWTGIATLANGGSVPGVIYSILLDGNRIVIGGQFTSVNGVKANNIAQLEGSTWSALGNGVSGAGVNPVNGSMTPIRSIARMGDDIHVGGNFEIAGPGIEVNNLARWTGSYWAAVGRGVSGYYVGNSSGPVNVLAQFKGSMIVGGEFLSAGETPAPGIAVFDGEVWMPLGGGVDGIVRTIAIDGRDIYIGGDFATAGGVTAGNVALWNGDAWRALGSGINGRVNGIAITEFGIYFVGRFTEAGGKPSYNVARLFRGTATVPPSTPLPQLASSAQPNPFTGATTIEFSLPRAAGTTLELLDLQGSVVAMLVDDNLAAGEHRYTWNPEGNIAAGLYVYRLRSDAGVANGMVVLVR